MESMVKGRIYPRALPNQGQDQLNELKFLMGNPTNKHFREDWVGLTKDTDIFVRIRG
jgi:hypothetical protein